jgi:hypothetical protein
VHELGFMAFRLVVQRLLNIDDFFIEKKFKLWLKISDELECAFGVIGNILMSRI